MSGFDDLKEKMEEGLKTLKETAQDIAFSVEKQAKISKKKYLDLSKVERTIQKHYGEIGEHVFDLLTSHKQVKADDPFLHERITAIIRLQKEMDDIEDEILEIQKTHPEKNDPL